MLAKWAQDLASETRSELLLAKQVQNPLQARWAQIPTRELGWHLLEKKTQIP